MTTMTHVEDRQGRTLTVGTRVMCHVAAGTVIHIDDADLDTSPSVRVLFDDGDTDEFGAYQSGPGLPLVCDDLDAVASS